MYWRIVMIKEHLQDICKTIDMAKKRDAIPSLVKKDGTVCKGFFSLGDVEKTNPEYSTLDEALHDFLNTLEYEVLEALQVLMLLGRGDCDCINENVTGEELYLKAKAELSDVLDKNREEIIYYVTSKGCVGEYLEKGLELLSM